MKKYFFICRDERIRYKKIGTKYIRFIRGKKWKITQFFSGKKKTVIIL